MGLALAACATPLDPLRDDSHFREPQRYVGQQVSVCGVVTFVREDQNIWFSEAEAQYVWTTRPDGSKPLGLGLLIDREVRLGSWPHGRRGCFRGEIIYTGCWDHFVDGSAIFCKWTPFNYALRIKREAGQPGLPGRPAQSLSSGTP